MIQSRFHSLELQKFATRLSFAKSPRDLAIIQSLLGKDLYGIRAIVSLPVYGPGPNFLPIKLSSSLFDTYIVPYFQYPHIYFIHHEIIQPSRLVIDYTVSFDTNFASYVRAIVKAGSLDGQQEEVKHAIDNMLYNDLNFDTFFYFIENIKIAYPIALKLKNSELDSPLKFWKSLDTLLSKLGF